MKIDSINTKYLSATFKKMIPVFILILTSHLLLTIYFKHEEEAKRELNLRQTLSSYQSNISEKFSILTSSTLFLDFVRSGNATREDQLLDIKILFSNLKDDAVKGVTVFSEDEAVFKAGEESNDSATLKLCYLNDFLNSNLGSCRNHLKIFFDKNKLISKLTQMNSDIQVCSSCNFRFLEEGKALGSFKVQEESHLLLPIEIKPSFIQQSLFFFELVLFALIIIVLISVHASFTTISSKFLTVPIKDIVDSLNKKNTTNPDSYEINELRFLSRSLNDFILKSKDQEELKRKAAIGELATQVAHDIRSPLEILKSTKDDLTNLPSEVHSAIILSINRLEEIAYSLLKRNKDPSQEKEIKEELTTQSLVTLIDDVILEKRIRFSLYPVEIESKILEKSLEHLSSINKVSLKNIISNMINNSVESITNTGKILITLEYRDNWNIIHIEDNGTGIKPEIINNIFTRGTTTKDDGNGIGLYTAKNEVNSWGGKIEVTSTEGVGTKFSLFLPNIKELTKQEITKLTEVVLIDDDKFIHLNWKMYLEARNIKVHNFKSIEHFLQNCSTIPKATPIYIDSELGDNIKGEIESEKIYHKGYTNLYLSTGHDKETIKRPLWINKTCSKNPSEVIQNMEANPSC